MDKRRKAVILTKIPNINLLSSLDKSSTLRSPYLNDENIKHLNEKLGMTLPTWEETEKYNESLKIL